MVNLENGAAVKGDYWVNIDCRPIHEKKADAVLKLLQSLNGILKYSRVEVLSDNMGVIGSWKKQGGQARTLNCILKETVWFVVCCTLTFFALGRPFVCEKSWSMVESLFDPHSVYLMCLDPSVMHMRSIIGKALNHFTP